MKIELYIGTELADFDEVFNVMFSIGDVRGLGFGSNNQTYTLNLPLTKTNKRLISYINQPDVKTEPSSTARLYLNGLLIISGLVMILDYNDFYIKIIINSDDWIETLKERRLIDLDLSASDHTYNSTNIIASWTAAYPLYRYPMINFGGLASSESGSAATWLANDFIPMISVSQLITKIFYPYTISSTWLATSFVKDLFIIGKEKITEDTFIQNKQLNAEVESTDDNKGTWTVLAGATTTTVITLSPILFYTIVKDEGGDFYGGEYTVPETGTYRIQAFLDMVLSGENVTVNSIQSVVKICKLVGGAGSPVDLATVTTNYATIVAVTSSVTVDTMYVHLVADDVIYCEYVLTTNFTNSTGNNEDFVLVANLSSTIENIWTNVNKHIGVSASVSLEEMLPDISQLDFIAAIRDIFNLRFWFDKMRQVIYIEPWDSFLSSTVIDLTPYIDFQDKPTELISQYYNKTTRLKWKDDTKDKAYEEYLKTNLIGIGYKDVALTSIYAKKEIEEREHSFSSLVTGYNYVISEFTTSVPRIWNTVSVSPFTFDRLTGFNTRIVEWKGLTAGFTWYYDSVAKTDYPKIAGLDWTTLFSTYWQKFFHYIDKGKIFTMRMKVNPLFLTQFFTVINTAANEGFRPTYQIEINGIDNYFFLQKLTTDGETAELELVLKQ